MWDKTICSAFKLAAKELEIPIEWGGDWKSFCDTPHFQLPWQQYPADSKGQPKDRTERDLLLAGSRTVKAARLVRRAGQAAVATGAVVTTVVNDPLGAASNAVTAVGQSREVVTAAKEQVTWLMSPGNVGIALAVLGIIIAAGAAAIISYRVEDDNTGLHSGRK